MKYLGLDLSLSSPGFAVIEVRERRPRLVAASHVKTDPGESRVSRCGQIADELAVFVRKHRPFDAIIREDFVSKNPGTQKAVYAVWHVVDCVLDRFGHAVTADMNQGSIKKALTGDGKAGKEAVEVAVRRCLKLKDSFEFGSNDESDACGVVLAWLIREGLIEGEAEV